jgi:hypothetical protein
MLMSDLNPADHQRPKNEAFVPQINTAMTLSETDKPTRYLVSLSSKPFYCELAPTAKQHRSLNQLRMHVSYLDDAILRKFKDDSGRLQKH